MEIFQSDKSEGWASYDKDRFFSFYPYGGGGYMYFLCVRIGSRTDRRQVINPHTGMVDKYFKV